MKTRKLGKRTLSLVFVLGLMFSIAAVSASAASYDLYITSPFAGSMKSSSLVKRTSSTTPYVQPSLNTISTNYLLSPARLSSTDATNIIAKSNTTKSNFTYKSGYGGTNQSYCLSAYPNVSGSYNGYTARGSFGV